MTALTFTGLYGVLQTPGHTNASPTESRVLETTILRARKGDAEAQYQLGLRYRTGQGVTPLREKSLEWLKQAALQGHSGAQLYLGVSYMDYGGDGSEPDLRQARHWLSEAAEQGERDAQYLLGTMYAEGQGVIQDYVQGAEWFKRAAEAGHAEAMYHLGMMYATGEGVAKDRVQAYVWFNLAAAAGDHSAMIAREEVAGLLSPEQLAQGQARSRDLDKQ